MNLEGHISNLLLSHDCVIVPDFGAFIAQKSAATIAENQIHPPTRKIGFNSLLNKSDGLLIQRLIHLDKLSFEEAQSEINDQVSVWKTVLAKNLRLELNGLGEFEVDEEGKLLFSPIGKNYLVESFGLDAVNLVRVMSQKTEAPSRNKVIWWKVASIVPIVLGGYLYFAKPQPVTNYVNQQWSGFVMPLLGSVNKAEVSSEIKVNLEQQAEKKLVENTLEDKVELAETVEVKAHQVIAGSFRILSEAESFEQKLKENGFEKAMFTQKKGSYYYVAYDTFETKEEANEYRRSIQSKHPDAWVLSITN